MTTARLIVKRLLGMDYFHPDYKRDIFIASYPRSGNTWIRAIVHYLQERRPPQSLSELDYTVPDAHYQVSRASVVRRNSYVVKTHDVYRSQFKRALYVVRNPIDALESHYRYIVETSQPHLSIENFAIAAASGSIWPSSWSEHLSTWTYGMNGNTDNILMVRYEDLVAGEERASVVLSCILRKAGIDVDVHDVDVALKLFSFEKMKALERAGLRDLRRPGADNWFVGGLRSGDLKDIIRREIEMRRPEILEMASKHGYR